MTLEEKIIATGFTTINFCPDIIVYLKEVELRLKRPIFSHELPRLAEEIKAAFEEDFIKMCIK